MLKILHNRLLPYRFFYPALRLDVERIRLHRGELALCIELPRTRLTQELCEPMRIRLCGNS